jgi:hypothetical protein
MRNETSSTSGIGGQHLVPDVGKAVFEVLGAEGETTSMADRARGDESLLAYLDREFRPLMEEARENTPATALDPERRPNGIDPADKAMLEQYMAQLAAGPAAFLPAVKQTDIAKAVTSMSPRRGLGPRVFIGFDAEWQYLKKGRNLVLSVQFYMVGPTGEVLTKVIHLQGRGATGDRLKLAETLCELLEQAEDECVFDEWPSEVVLVGFFTRADITVFADFSTFRHQLDGVGGTLASVKGAAHIELPMQLDRQARLRDRYRYTVGDAFDPRILNVRLVDASRLAPPGSSLAALGKFLGIEKVELPEGHSKDNMARFQREDRDAFEKYGIQDARIAVMHVLWVYWFSDRYLGIKGLAATVGGLATRLAQLCIREDGVHLDVALNYERKRKELWNTRTGRAVTKTMREPRQARAWLETFLADAYLGGRNECYLFGPTWRRRYFDLDLAAAYGTGMAYPLVLDYDQAQTCHDVERYSGHVAGFAKVRFQFPADTRFPCLPVPVDNRGLYFPLSGESVCTAPEIELALKMGAKIEIVFGVIIPWMDRAEVFRWSQQVKGSGRPIKRQLDADDDLVLERDDDGDFVVPQEMEFPPPHHGDEGYRTYESFVIFMRWLRAKFRRKTLPFEFAKLLFNSLYGKTGQGFKDKRTFGPREMGSVTIGPSPVSEAAVAAMVCGFVRAVLGEILWKLPPTASVVSATTDGILLDVPLEQLDLSGEMCRRFKGLLDRVAPGTSMLEVKHQVMQVVAMRTRGQLTGEADGEHKIVLAKAGVKPPPDEEDENAYMINLFLKREPDQKLRQESFISMREQLTKGWDLQMDGHDVRLNLDFDFKRNPVNPRMEVVSCSGVEHLAFDTVPWQTAEDGVRTRVLFDQWRKTRCLKTMADWEDWQAFLAHQDGNRRRATAARALHAGDAEGGSGGVTRGAGGRVYKTKTGFVGIALRTFLTAYVQRAWGLTDVDLSQRALADWLTEQGYPTTPSAVKNAGRALLNASVVPATEEVMTFLTAIKARFPGLAVERFFFAQLPAG